MNALVVYDSKFGNTRNVAIAIGDVLEQRYTVQVLPVTEAVPLPYDIDLLIVGGPTQAHGMSPGMKAFLGTLEHGSLRGVAAAAFDTRFNMSRLLSGSAATGIAQRLRRNGCTLVASTASFFVERGQAGPLSPGELDRAREWAQAMLAAIPAATGQPTPA